MVSKLPAGMIAPVGKSKAAATAKAKLGPMAQGIKKAAAPTAGGAKLLGGKPGKGPKGPGTPRPVSKGK